MAEHAVDALARAAIGDRRRAIKALGVAGLATSLTGSFTTSAKQSAGKKRKKKCNKQKQACLDGVSAFCLQFFQEEAQACETELNLCCATCDVATGVVCTATALTPVK